MSTKKPVIGISMSILRDANGVFSGYERAYINSDYIDSINEADAIAMPLPVSLEADILEYYTSNISGLILSGGHDVDPHLYHQEMSPKIGEICPSRDRFEMKLIKLCVKKKKPILGICRGMQLINVAFGGTLYQELSLRKKSTIKHWQNQDCSMGVHKVKFKKDNFFYELYGKKIFTNSWHHQIVQKLAPNLQACGTTSDGVIEAVEDKQRKIIAVQWHPEMMHNCNKEAKKLFCAFIKYCKKENN